MLFVEQHHTYLIKTTSARSMDIFGYAANNLAKRRVQNMNLFREGSRHDRDYFLAIQTLKMVCVQRGRKLRSTPCTKSHQYQLHCMPLQAAVAQLQFTLGTERSGEICGENRMWPQLFGFHCPSIANQATSLLTFCTSSTRTSVKKHVVFTVGSDLAVSIVLIVARTLLLPRRHHSKMFL